MNPMAVVTLAPCSFVGNQYVPYVWFDVAERWAGIDRLGNAWLGYYWLAFEHESS